jgi:RNA ligase
MIDLRAYPLKRVNSLTKYPSIPTYHGIDIEQHKLVEPRFYPPVNFGPVAVPVVVTEKINGTNGRIVFTRNDYFIGSREEFVYAKDDYMGDHKDGVMDALKPLAERFVRESNGMNEVDTRCVCVAYFEVYGGRINWAKHYTSTEQVGVRLFDVACILDSEEMLQKEPEKIAAWRDHGGQHFLDAHTMRQWAGTWATHARLGIPVVPEILRPLGGRFTSFDLKSESLAQTLEWLLPVCGRSSKAALDEGATGAPEGIVVRTPDRSVIAKLRIEDYERALRPPQGRKKGS